MGFKFLSAIFQCFVSQHTASLNLLGHKSLQGTVLSCTKLPLFIQVSIFTNKISQWLSFGVVDFDGKDARCCKVRVASTVLAVVLTCKFIKFISI
jgi:hypothetical protein